jgi:NADPH-dependent 2,4-dienoyl-CoA reductase/sulfur reductase-like enzyme
METVDRIVDPMSLEEGWRLPLARQVKDAVGVPVMATGPFRHPERAEQAVEEGVVDLIALGRPLLADPQWAAKARRGQAEDIRHCTSCNWCVGRREKGTGCAENPRTGRELDPPLGRFGLGRTAVVVGAGPGGVVAAVLLDQAGFKVRLIEAGPVLGGGLIASAAPPFKDKLFWYLSYLERRMGESAVELSLNTRADAAMILALRPDAVIVASGAQPLIHAIDGVDQPHVLSAYDLLMAPEDGDAVAARPGSIVVYGGGETGCETAEFLTERGAEVTLVTRSGADQLARSAERLYRKQLLARLAENPRLTVIANSRIVRIGPDDVEVAGAAGASRLVPCAQLVLAQGRATGGDLIEPLRDAGMDCHAIGDVREIRRIGDAVSDAYLAVRALSQQTAVVQLAC